MTGEEVLVLEPGDDRAKKIGKALSNASSSDILHLLGEGEKTLTELSESLGQPITTVKYNVENLLDAGMVDIVRTRYSEKGRVVKVYGVRDQVVIVSPGRADVKSLLMKYASLFALIVVASLIIAGIGPLFSGMGLGDLQAAQEPMLRSPAPAVTEDTVAVMDFSGEDGAQGAAKAAGTGERNDAGAQSLSDAMNFAAMAFFLGGFVAILTMLLYEVLMTIRAKHH
ncbi:MAG TPA: ArsR family transcriptional regulator [Methanoculleus sp.]|nr:ArsR family transcriptional regulator [Methanoculleus sp.]